jgi:hypothetical protein
MGRTKGISHRAMCFLMPGTGEDAIAGPFKMLDEQDWPGGYAQKFRALRPVVDEVLEG